MKLNGITKVGITDRANAVTHVPFAWTSSVAPRSQQPLGRFQPSFEIRPKHAKLKMKRHYIANKSIFERIICSNLAIQVQNNQQKGEDPYDRAACLCHI